MDDSSLWILIVQHICDVYTLTFSGTVSLPAKGTFIKHARSRLNDKVFTLAFLLSLKQIGLPNLDY